MSRFNDWLGGKITDGVSTMWCAYIFAGLAIYGYPYGSTDPKTIVQWFAQTFLQLVLLSIILVGQKLQSNKHNEIISHVKKIHAHLGIKEDSL